MNEKEETKPLRCMFSFTKIHQQVHSDLKRAMHLSKIGLKSQFISLGTGLRMSWDSWLLMTKTVLVEIPNSTVWSSILDIPGSHMVATTVQPYAVLYAAAHLFKHRTKFGNYSPLQTIQNGKTVRPCTLSAPDSCTPDLNGQTLPYIIFDIFVFYGLHIWEKWKKTTQMKRNAKWSIICATKNLKHMWMVISHSGQTACPPPNKNE